MLFKNKSKVYKDLLKLEKFFYNIDYDSWKMILLKSKWICLRNKNDKLYESVEDLEKVCDILSKYYKKGGVLNEKNKRGN